MTDKDDDEVTDLVAVSGDDIVEPQVVTPRQEIADKLRRRVVELRTQLTEGYFEMGAILYRIQKESLYTLYIGPGGKPYDRFEYYVEHEVDFAFRKAKYLMSIWWWFAHEVGDPEVFAKVKEVGWQKAAYLAQIVDSKNVDQWVEKAKKLSIRDLNAETREAMKGAGFDSRQALRARGKDVTLKNQPEETLTGEPSTQGAPLPSPTPMSAAPEQQRMGIDPLSEGEEREIRTVWSVMLSRSQRENIESSIEMAADIAETATDGKGYLLDFVATAFAAINATVVAKPSDRKGAFRGELLRAVEQALHVDLVAFDNGSMRVVYGDDVIDRLVKGDDDAGQS